ncbi:MAG TPA: HAD-IA family hydrolase [Gaiellaceae bacterium]|nr:HAD-IA family hydrolase [Gaiellaceae bacterium]
MIRALALDFDGVVVESVELKNRAFGELFRETHPDKVEAVIALHKANMGVSRYEKFPRIYAEVLGEPFPEGESERLDRALTALVYEGVVACEFVPGARELIERRSREVPVFVASATPEEEVRSLVEARGLAPFVTAAYGSPARKADSLRRIAAEAGCATADVLFVGDTTSDQRAAREAGVVFVGRVPAGEASPFEPEDGVRTVADLAELDALWDELVRIS